MSVVSSWRLFAVRRLDAGQLLDIFLLSAITCLLVIRLFLYLTDYPQIGNDTLHIAHMLWGGLGMLAAIIVLIAFPTRVAARVAALIGGLGFGAFIDELGKFITSDNDYFFQPTIGIIYLIFIALYLAFRELEGMRPSQTTDLINAIEMTKEAALRAMGVADRERALALLGRCDQRDPLVRGLTVTLRGYEGVATGPPGLGKRMRAAMVRFYKRLIAWRLFGGAIVTVAVVIALVGLGTAVAAVWEDRIADYTFSDWGSIASAVVSGILVLLGVLQYRRSRLRAYRLFDGSVLVGIFVGQFFSFLQQELAAIGGLLFLLLCHGVLRYLIDQEVLVRVERAGEGYAVAAEGDTVAAAADEKR